MKKIIFSLVLAASTLSLFAQGEQTIMSGNKLGLSGIWGGWSYNIGGFNGNYNSYNGGMFGLEFGKKLLVGGSHYSLGNAPLNGKGDYFNLTSSDLYLGYTPNSYKAIHPIVSLSVGGGTVNVNSENVGQNVYTIHPAVGLELNAMRICHIDAQVGYRAVMNSKYINFKDTDFSGLYAQVNLKFGFSWKKYN